MSNSIVYSNPRKHAVIDNWPYGKFRTTATFEVEANKRGERVVRTTINPKNGAANKPKALTYSQKMRIVDGSDDKTYIIELSMYGHITVRASDMRYEIESIWPENPKHAQVLALFSE